MQQATEDEIEMAAIKGAALAGLLSSSTTLHDAEQEDLRAAFSALEGFFRDILKAMDTPRGA